MATLDTSLLLNKISRRRFLQSTSALAVVPPTVARATEQEASSSNGRKRVFAYVGTYSSPQGPEGSRGNGKGIYLFDMNPSTGALEQREVLRTSRTRHGWRSILLKRIYTRGMRRKIFRALIAGQ